MNCKREWLRAALSIMILAAPAAAGPVVVFNNFPIDGTLGGWTVGEDYYEEIFFQVSDSFTLSSAATLTGVNIGVWSTPGDTITSVSWAIGTGAYGTSEGSGTASGASFSYTFLDYNSAREYNIGEVSFSLPDIPLSAGMYYLTLTNFTDTSSEDVYWDINDAAGINAYESYWGKVSNGSCYEDIYVSGTCTSTFQILGLGPSSVPEPATGGLFGSAILLAAGLRRKLAAR